MRAPGQIIRLMSNIHLPSTFLSMPIGSFQLNASEFSHLTLKRNAQMYNVAFNLKEPMQKKCLKFCNNASNVENYHF